jgi:hypothetical protein
MALYHISKVSNLKIIEPRISTHKKPLVYAVKNLTTGLLFGAPKDDFDFLISQQNGVTHLYECYPNAFIEKYSNKQCYIYELEESGFLENQTSWKVELVNPNSVKVINETKVLDLKARLEVEITNGNLVIHKYENSKKYKDFVEEQLTTRIFKFGILDKEAIRPDILKHHGKLIEKLKQN